MGLFFRRHNEILLNRIHKRIRIANRSRRIAGKEEKEKGRLIALFLKLSTTALEAFTMGASAAISLYCGSKTPRNRRK